MLPVRVTSPPLAVTVKERATVFALDQFNRSFVMVVAPVPREDVRVILAELAD